MIIEGCDLLMKAITLKIEYSDFLNNDLINYLSSLDGVCLSKIDNEKNEIYVEYDSSIISLKLLKMEILLYLDITKIPSIISFDKHSNNVVKKDNIIIKDLCCEYCLKGMLEDLLDTDGIESACTNFDYANKHNVNIFITYDYNLISNDKLKELKEKYNHY